MKKHPVIHCLFAGILAGGWLLASSASASPAPELAAAVDFLLERTRESNATFIRNGEAHTAQEAVEHMQKKYAHFLKKGQVKTPEDFIRLAGTRSLLSGKVYTLKLPDGRERPTAEWLSEQLAEYRACPGES